MREDHINILTELGSPKFPLEIRLKAGELLSMLILHHIGDKEVPLAAVSVEFVTPNLTRERVVPPT